jgi:hypothetical protein
MTHFYYYYYSPIHIVFYVTLWNFAATILKSFPFFAVLQINFCKRNPSFMDSVRLGAARAIDECQFQFRSRRWNCSTLEDNINDNMEMITTHLNNMNNMGGGGSGMKHPGLDLQSLNLNYKSHGGGGFEGSNLDGLQPQPQQPPYDLMYNAYGQRTSDRASRQAMHQQINRNRNVRRGRRLSRRGKQNFFLNFRALFSLFTFGQPKSFWPVSSLGLSVFSHILQ